jgi:hypothetical protein
VAHELLDNKAQERKRFLVTFHLGGMGENQLFLHFDSLKLLSTFAFASYLNNYGLICQFYKEVRSFSLLAWSLNKETE